MLYDKETKEKLLEGLEGFSRDVTEHLLNLQADPRNAQTTNITETVAAGITGTGNFARMDKLVGPLIRRVAPALVAMELVGVQPMSGPTALIRTMRQRYSTDLSGTGGPAANEEASGVKVYEKYSKIASGESYTASDARDAAAITLALEANPGNDMNIEVIKQTVTAEPRKLRSKWTLEADQDAQALDGLSIENEMVTAMSEEIIRQIDREILDDLDALAGTVKTFDFATADGRYASEKFTAFSIGVSDIGNQIAIKTKRGGPSWMVISPNVLTALRHASNGSFVAAAPTAEPSTSLFVGTMNGHVRVYVDVYATTDKILMGYKGAGAYDTGFVYCPYIPLSVSEVVTDSATMDPMVALMTRFGKCDFTNTSTSLGNSSDFYGRATVANLKLGF